MLWNTKTEIGVQQYDYEICRLQKEWKSPLTICRRILGDHASSFQTKLLKRKGISNTVNSLQEGHLWDRH